MTLASGLAGRGMPSIMDASRLFGVRRAPTGNARGLAEDAPGVAGAASILQSISRFKGQKLSEAEARKAVASNTNNANSTLFPTKKGVNALNSYIKKVYGSKKPSADIQRALEAAKNGGINDFGLSVAVSRDQERRKALGETSPKIGGLGGGAPLDAVKAESPYFNEVLMTPVNIAKAQNAKALGPTGPGLFGALLAVVNPTAAALFSASQGAMNGNALQAFGSLATAGALQGAFDPLIESVKGKFDSLTQNSLQRANAVPGIRTGVATPTGGGLVGSGQLNPETIGIAGGAPLGASPLAVAGGAAAANLFPRFPEFGTVQPLQPGRIPGTNRIVGGDVDSIDSLLDGLSDAISNFTGTNQRVTLNDGGFSITPVNTTIPTSDRRAINPLDFSGFRLPDRLQQELDNPFPVYGLANGITFPQRLGSMARIRPFNQQARGGTDIARRVEQVRRTA